MSHAPPVCRETQVLTALAAAGPLLGTDTVWKE
jgi:hypothetical protein